MPLVAFTHEPINIDLLPDVNTNLPRTATLTGFSVTIDNGQYSMIVSTEKSVHKKNSDGSVGEILTDGNYRPTPVALTAANDCAVYWDATNLRNPRNGQVLYYKRGLSPYEWGTLSVDSVFTPLPLTTGLAQVAEPVLLQGQWLELMAKILGLSGLLHMHMLLASQPPSNLY